MSRAADVGISRHAERSFGRDVPSRRSPWWPNSTNIASVRRTRLMSSLSTRASTLLGDLQLPDELSQRYIAGANCRSADDIQAVFRNVVIPASASARDMVAASLSRTVSSSWMRSSVRSLCRIGRRGAIAIVELTDWLTVALPFKRVRGLLNCDPVRVTTMGTTSLESRPCAGRRVLCTGVGCRCEREPLSSNCRG